MPAERERDVTLRLAAAGDIHVSEANAEATATAFRDIDGSVDLILLAGDLTAIGEPAQAEALDAAGVKVLDPGWTICCVEDVEVGVVGVKGFVGGFPGSHLPDFGEPSLRAVYAETGEQARALDEGLRAVAACPFRIVLLHYAPTAETLRGEPDAIWTFLGSDRLGAPIIEHQPDLVLHGHAHAGTFEGRLAGIPVFNVSVPVIGRDFWVFELTGAARHPAEIH